MAKVQIKSDKYTPFGGFFFVANEFKRHIMPHIDEYLGIRCKMKGCQYSDILGSTDFSCGKLTKHQRQTVEEKW